MIPCLDDATAISTSLEEALALSKDLFHFDLAKIYYKDLTINESGDFLIQNTKFGITKGGIRNLCSTLRIPDPFANRIPDDLFKTNVNRLLQENANNRINAYFDKQENIVDINSHTNHQAIPTANLLSKLDDDGRLHRFMFQNHSVKIETVPEKSSFEVESIKQAASVGNVIHYYPTAKSIPVSYMLLWTLSCSNGMIAPRQYMREKLNIKGTSDADILIAKFLEKIKVIGFDADALKLRFDDLTKRRFLFEEVKKIYAGIKRLVGKDEVENVLGSSFISTYQYGKEASIGDEEPTEISGYDVFYQITYYASNVTKSPRLSKQLQTKAGRLLLDDTI